MTLAAMIAPQSVSPRPTKLWITTGSVLRVSSFMKVSASMNSFQPSRKHSTAVVARPGAASGRIPPPHRAQPRRAVGARSVLELVGYPDEEAAHHPDRQRDREGEVGDDQPGVRPQ